ncbi:hypothetical protein B0H13DRAFT_2346127 [Mycena leptocephala]|nr:hypothetical protein B0H13DRAFT_2346127 [Mycena leptocephala]
MGASKGVRSGVNTGVNGTTKASSGRQSNHGGVNLTFLDSGPAYTLSIDTSNVHTELRAAGTGELLARIARKEIIPDTIAFPALNGGREMRSTKWLTKSKLSDGCSAHVIKTKHGNFTLKTHPVHRLALFREDDLETPGAHWQRASTGTSTSTTTPTLVLRPGTHIWVSAWPEIIMAFVVQESKMRMREQANQPALGRATGQFGLVSGAK